MVKIISLEYLFSFYLRNIVIAKSFQTPLQCWLMTFVFLFASISFGIKDLASFVGLVFFFFPLRIFVLFFLTKFDFRFQKYRRFSLLALGLLVLSVLHCGNPIFLGAVFQGTEFPRLRSREWSNLVVLCLYFIWLVCFLKWIQYSVILVCSYS